MEDLIKYLIEKTKKCELEWKPIVLIPDFAVFTQEYNSLVQPSIISSSVQLITASSYFLSQGSGYLALCTSLITNTQNVPQEQTSLFTKVNSYLPLSNDGNFPAFAKDFEVLKLLIQNNIAHKYPMPDTL